MVLAFVESRDSQVITTPMKENRQSAIESVDKGLRRFHEHHKLDFVSNVMWEILSGILGGEDQSRPRVAVEPTYADAH